MVHSTFLVDLRLEASTKLAYWPPLANYKSDVDDILLFAHSARQSGIQIHYRTIIHCIAVLLVTNLSSNTKWQQIHCTIFTLSCRNEDVCS